MARTHRNSFIETVARPSHRRHQSQSLRYGDNPAEVGSNEGFASRGPTPLGNKTASPFLRKATPTFSNTYHSRASRSHANSVDTRTQKLRPDDDLSTNRAEVEPWEPTPGRGRMYGFRAAAGALGFWAAHMPDNQAATSQVAQAQKQGKQILQPNTQVGIQNGLGLLGEEKLKGHGHLIAWLEDYNNGWPRPYWRR